MRLAEQADTNRIDQRTVVVMAEQELLPIQGTDHIYIYWLIESAQDAACLEEACDR